jgi:hypothetical protein
MAYEALISYIQSIVRSNFNEEITGQNMQDVLLTMVSELGKGEFVGVATAGTNPGVPSGSRVYITSQAGYYQHFSLFVEEREMALLIWGNGVWFKETIIVFPEPYSDDRKYRHTQNTPESTWNVTHNFGKIPSVTITDSSGNEVEGEVTHIDLNSLTIVFSASFAGYADLN